MLVQEMDFFSASNGSKLQPQPPQLCETGVAAYQVVAGV